MARLVPISHRPRGSVRREGKREEGFALLVTITLVAFLVLLLVGLATYTRIESAISGNQQRQIQARENALLALQVALGQLQAHAGPDQRVTATGESTAVAGAKNYTGVWDADSPGVTPRTWLVSGSEAAGAQPDDLLSAALAPTTLATDDQEFLVGLGSVSANSDRIKVAKQNITTVGVPGQSGSVRIGRYAWWVGDQGVKAPVAVADTSAAVTFDPYGDGTLQNDAGRRIRQQISLGAGAANAGGSPVFEPRDTNNDAKNASLVADTNRNPKVTAFNQLAFLRNAANAQVGLAAVRPNFHAWSPNNFAVLADTKNGGLRQDLSLSPALLGSAFTAWANYTGYTETPAAAAPVASGEGGEVVAPVSTSPSILPAYGSDPLRRRVTIMPHQAEGNGSHQITPILTYFLLTFNVRTQVPNGPAAAALEVRARWMLSMWNPYTAALVPENLRVEITGLPNSVQVINEETARAGPAGPPFSLRTAFGNPLNVNLPWDSTTIPDAAPAEDRQSWLPGRVYTWRSVANANLSSAVPSDGFDSEFYSRTLSLGGAGVERAVPSVSVIPNDTCHLEVNGGTSLGVRVYAVRASGDVLIGRFTSPDFIDAFTTSPQRIGDNGYQFSYVFRLAESVDTPAAPSTWLTTDGRDIRRRSPPAEIFVVEAEGNDPAAYENYATISKPARLLDRANDAYSYNEDVPLFELPHSPLLSLGALQHFRIVGQRPFVIGNPWSSSLDLNGIRLPELFDRFFFSGLADGVTPTTSPTGDLILPNPLLRPLRKPDATKVTLQDVRDFASPPSTTDADGNVVAGPPGNARSSKFFLQGGAFNLNSVSAAAWTAVLRGVRFPAPQSFGYLDASADTGTAGDDAIATVQSGDAQFFRFSQTAQETYKAEPGLSASGDDTGATPPNTELFRKGMRTLSAAEVAALAAKIVGFVKAKHADSGPFRSMDEFLSPNALFAGADTDGNTLGPRSLLEAAIADAGINASIAEFSSQWLTQADVMTALAPVLFPRSDTFVIRAYGEAVNPATTNTEGRAWCEAIVQRLPDFVDSSDPAETSLADFDAPSDPSDATSAPTAAHTLNKSLGRRFKVISFRWLSRSDI